MEGAVKARTQATAGLGDTLLGARDANNKFQYVHRQSKNVQEAYDFLTGNQTNAQRIDSLAKGSKAIYGATGPHQPGATSTMQFSSLNTRRCV